MGLRYFLNGSPPYAPTLRRLTRWMERQDKEGARRELDEAFAVLLRKVPEEERPAARRTVEDLLGLPRSKPPPKRLVRCTWPGCGREIATNAMGSHWRAHRLREDQGMG